DDFDDVEEVDDEISEPDSSGWKVSNPDAIGLILLGLAAIVGASVWLDIAGPIGAALAQGIRLVIGAGALVLPVALIASALVLVLGKTGLQPVARSVHGQAVCSLRAFLPMSQCRFFF